MYNNIRLYLATATLILRVQGIRLPNFERLGSDLTPGGMYDARLLCVDPSFKNSYRQRLVSDTPRRSRTATNTIAKDMPRERTRERARLGSAYEFRFGTESMRQHHYQTMSKTRLFSSSS